MGHSVTVGFDSVCRKKKLEEEEAEVKRKATDAAYQGKHFSSEKDAYICKSIWEILKSC